MNCIEPEKGWPDERDPLWMEGDGVGALAADHREGWGPQNFEADSVVTIPLLTGAGVRRRRIEDHVQAILSMPNKSFACAGRAAETLCYQELMEHYVSQGKGAVPIGHAVVPADDAIIADFVSGTGSRKGQTERARFAKAEASLLYYGEIQQAFDEARAEILHAHPHCLDHTIDTVSLARLLPEKRHWSDLGNTVSGDEIVDINHPSGPGCRDVHKTLLVSPPVLNNRFKKR